MSTKGLIKNTILKNGCLPIEKLNIDEYHTDIECSSSLVNVGVANSLLSSISTYTTSKPIEFNIGGIKRGMMFNNTPISDILDMMFKGCNFNPVVRINFTVINNESKNVVFPLFTLKDRGVGVGFINIDYGDGYTKMVKYNKEEDYIHYYVYKKGVYKVSLSFDSKVDTIELEDDTTKNCYVKNVNYPELYIVDSLGEKVLEELDVKKEKQITRTTSIFGTKSLTLDKFNTKDYITNLCDKKSLINISCLKQLVKKYLYYSFSGLFNFSVGNIVKGPSEELKLSEVFYKILLGDSTYDIEINLTISNNTEVTQKICLCNVLTFDSPVIGRVEYDKLEGESITFDAQSSIEDLNRVIKYEESIGEYNSKRIYDILSLYQPFYKDIPKGEHKVRILLSKGVKNIVFFDTHGVNNYIVGIQKFKVDGLKYLDSTFTNIPNLKFEENFKLEGSHLEIINSILKGLGGEENIIKIPKGLLINLNQLRSAIGVFSNSYIENIPRGLLDNNLELECIDYLFYRSKIGTNPLGQIHINSYLDLIEDKKEDIIIPTSLFWKNNKIRSFNKVFDKMLYKLGEIKGYGDIPFLLRKEFLEVGKAVTFKDNIVFFGLIKETNFVLDQPLYEFLDKRKTYKLVSEKYKRVL